MKSATVVSSKRVNAQLLSLLIVALFTAGAMAANPVPLINQPLVPDAVKPGGAAFTLTVNGTGFVPGAVVKWNGGTRTTTYVSSSRVTATILATDIAVARTASVSVVNPGPGGGTSNVVFFPVSTSAPTIAVTSTQFSSGPIPQSIATGDFNRDGKLDLVVANNGASSITVFLGNGNGTFQTGVNYSTGINPSSVAVGDLNGDGKPDLVVTSSNSNVLSVLLGNGDGTFQAHVDYDAGPSPAAVALGDFNRDGKLDLAVANYFQPGTVSVLLGNGNGTFQSAVSYTVGLDPSSVAVGDFNHDGKLDLAVTNQSSTSSTYFVSVLLGKGDGTFQPAMNYPTGPGPTSVSVADFNKDGKLDLVVTNGQFQQGTISVLLGNGDGTFQAAVNYGAGDQPSWVSVGDLNGDGNLDLTVSNLDIVNVLLGKGDGTFQPALNFNGGADTINPDSVVIGDFDRDGMLDIAVANLTNTISVFLHTATVKLSRTTITFANQVFQTRSSAQTVILTDFVKPLSISTIAIAGSNAADFTQSNNCGSGLAVGASCTISVMFKPTALGVRTGSLVINDNAGGSPQSVPLSGTGITPVLLSATTVRFSNQLVGMKSAARNVTLTNRGSLSLNFNSIVISGPNAADFSQTNNCGSTIPGGAQCTLSLFFKPSNVGPRSASVVISDNSPDTPQVIAMAGTGVLSGPNATLSASSLTFATQVVGTTSATKPVTLSNYGTSTLNITSIGVNGDFIRSSTCGLTLSIGSSCAIGVTFKPTQINTRTGTLTLTDNAPTSPQKAAMKGAGTFVALNPAALSFGSVKVGQSKSLSTTLTNTAKTTLSITSVGISGANAGDFTQTNNCGTSRAAGASCTITVVFKPTVAGARSADVSLADNGGASPQQVPLTGTGFKSSATATVKSSLVQASSLISPTPTGSQKVGTRVVELIDRTRPDPFTTTSKRDLLVRIWYPAADAQKCVSAQYTSDRVWKYFSTLLGVRLPSVQTHSCWNARAAEGVFPVIVFTHGYTGTFTDYTFLLEDLASRGYIAVSVNHTSEATATEFPDGRFTTSLFGSHLAVGTLRGDEQGFSDALSARVGDIEFVLNELTRMNTTYGNSFAGKMDMDRVAIAGHSLGGLTALLGLQRDSRFKVGVLLDASLSEITTTSLSTPVLLLGSGRNQWSGSECRLWANLSGDRLALNLSGAEHLTTSDAVWLARNAVKTGSMGSDKTIDAVRQYVAAFLDANLSGRPGDSLLTGQSQAYQGVAVWTRNQNLCEVTH